MWLTCLWIKIKLGKYIAQLLLGFVQCCVCALGGFSLMAFLMHSFLILICTFDLTEPFRDHETGILDGFLLYFCRGPSPPPPFFFFKFYDCLPPFHLIASWSYFFVTGWGFYLKIYLICNLFVLYSQTKERNKLEALKKKQEQEEERMRKMEEDKKRKQEELKRLTMHIFQNQRHNLNFF